MLSLPAKPGLYVWQRDEVVVYIGQTGTPLAGRLGSNGYATIYAYNTLAKEAGRKNGGQQTNCRVNALANDALSTGSTLKIWYRVCSPKVAPAEEAQWMLRHGVPEWNRRIERTRYGGRHS
jgi:hypothetical protein